MKNVFISFSIKIICLFSIIKKIIFQFKDKTIYHSAPNAAPIPYDAPAESAPIMMVSEVDKYHLAPVTKLLLKPKMKRTTTASTQVIQI
jgi:hypothetical protein